MCVMVREELRVFSRGKFMFVSKMYIWLADSMIFSEIEVYFYLSLLRGLGTLFRLHQIRQKAIDAFLKGFLALFLTVVVVLLSSRDTTVGLDSHHNNRQELLKAFLLLGEIFLEFVKLTQVVQQNHLLNLQNQLI